jgi:hypothetical protein
MRGGFYLNRTTKHLGEGGPEFQRCYPLRSFQLHDATTSPDLLQYLGGNTPYC